MTGVTDREVREIRWASSEEGKAQLRAAWAKHVQLTGGQPTIGLAETSAMLWAAHEAVPDDGAAHDGTTTVLSGCMYCHRLIARAENSDDDDAWRVLPDRVTGASPALRGRAAIDCAASPDDRHHPPDGSELIALAHLAEM